MRLQFGCLTLVTILSLVFPRTVSSQTDKHTRSTPPADALAGCYELKLGRWWPWSFGEDNQFVTPPTKIQLLPVPGSEGFEINGSLIRPIPPSQRTTFGRRQFSYWQMSSESRLDLIWTDGLSGVTLKLTRHRDKLRGWAHPHFDFPTLPRLMHVTAVRTACDTAK